MTSSAHQVVAVPCDASGVLEAAVAAHFGRAPGYALITLQRGRVVAERLLTAAGSSPGHDCLGPVRRLRAAGAQQVLVQGVGARALAGLEQAGLQVFHSGTARTVGEALTSLLGGELRQLGPSQICDGPGRQA